MKHTIKCPECDGQGTIEVQECSYPASMCCGGCTKSITCSHCEGEEVITVGLEYIDNYHEQLTEVGKLYEKIMQEMKISKADLSDLFIEYVKDLL